MSRSLPDFFCKLGHPEAQVRPSCCQGRCGPHARRSCPRGPLFFPPGQGLPSLRHEQPSQLGLCLSLDFTTLDSAGLVRRKLGYYSEPLGASFHSFIDTVEQCRLNACGPGRIRVLGTQWGQDQQWFLPI